MGRLNGVNAMRWLLFVTLALWIYLILTVVARPRRHAADRLAQLRKTRDARGQRLTQKVQRQPIWKRIGRGITTNWISRWSQTRVQQVHLRLLRSGNPLNVTVPEWVGLRVLATCTGGLFGILILILTKAQLIGLVALLVFVVLGWLGPDFMLSRAITQRQRTLVRQLPSMLDLLSVSVEAGLGFEQALSRVSEKMSDPIAEEISRLLREIQLGSSRADALRRFADRSNVDAIRLFVSAVVQADKLGIGMSQVLHVQSDEVRRRRRMEAQEQGMKAPVKLIFPLLLFVFPAMFIVILGPVAIDMIKTLSHGI